MKKINITLLIVLGILLAVSCDSDRDSNPTIVIPDSFVLNTPSYASTNIDLINSISLELTTTQPDYGFTAAVVYSVQISLDDTWKDEGEDTKSSYGTLETTFSTTKMESVASEMARVIVSLAGWTEESQVPTSAMNVYVRLKAHVGVNQYPVYSNSVKLSIIPYFILLKDALPAPYYLIGEPIGDGAWDNSNIGVSIIPMALVEDFEYHKTTGKGEFVYTGYFPAGQGFKIIGIVGSWDEQWGNGDADGIDNPVHNDGGSKNFMVPTSGWYTVTLNSIENTLTIIPKADYDPVGYATMQIVGDFNDWNDENAILLTKSGGDKSHVWYADVTFNENTSCKFRTDNTWAHNWGGKNFPYGLAESSNLSAVAGSYIVIFNDLDRCYYFMEKGE